HDRFGPRSGCLLIRGVQREAAGVPPRVLNREQELIPDGDLFGGADVLSSADGTERPAAGPATSEAGTEIHCLTRGSSRLGRGGTELEQVRLPRPRVEVSSVHANRARHCENRRVHHLPWLSRDLAP